MSEREVVRPLPDEKPKSRACLYGCLVAVVVFMVLVIGAVAAVLYGGKMMLETMRDEYTDTTPMEIPEVDMPAGQTQDLMARVQAFVNTMEGNGDKQQLTLSDDEINMLLRAHPKFETFGDRVYVEIEEDVVSGQVSIPLDRFEVPEIFGLSGRYLNGSATFLVSLERGRPALYIEEMSVKGQPLPDEFIAAMRQENLAAEFAQDPELRKYLERIESVVIEDGHAVITLKGDQ